MRSASPSPLVGLSLLLILSLAADVSWAQPRRPAPPGPAIPEDRVAFTGRFPTGTGHLTARLRVGAEQRQVDLFVPRRRAARPPLLVLFHGTYGGGRQIMDEGRAQALANAQGVIVAAPVARYLSARDWDHPDGDASYWETHPDADPNHNPDLLLTRAILVAAQRAYAVDPARVYVAGHSSGAFFALVAATALRERVAAFAVNSGGLVRCETTAGCSFRGHGTTCATLARRPGWCSCAGPERPLALPTTGRRPAGFVGHGNDDNVVSVYYSCALVDALTRAGYPVALRVREGGGHDLPPEFLRDAWPFLAQHPLR